MKVGRWRHRYAQAGLPGILKDKSRPGRIAPIAASTRSRIVKMTLQDAPAGSTHWSRTSMSKASGVSASTVGRIWAAHGLKPHRVTGFKLSNDKQFQEKLEDIVGLYLNPPEHALVFSCDEKSQSLVQAQSSLPCPLYSNKCFVAQHDRTLLPRSYSQ